MRIRQSQPFLIGVRETWRGSRSNDAISSSTLDGMMKKAPKSSVETRPDLINTALLLLLQVDILWNPARQNVRVLAAISPAVSKASVRFEEGFFDEGWPQFAILSRESAHKFVTGLDENAMIDFHTARNAVEEEADVVFAKTIDSGSAVCLWVNNARNQGFFKARLVESAGNHRRNDCAIIDTVLRMNQGEKTHLNHTKGIQRSVDDTDRVKNAIRIFKITTLLYKIGRELVIVIIFIHCRIKTRSVRIIPRTERDIIDDRGPADNLALTHRQFTINIEFFFVGREGRWSANRGGGR